MQIPTNSGAQPSMQEILRLAQTPEGKQILALLKKKNAPLLNSIVSSAISGNYDAARQSLNAFLNDPEIQVLLTKLEGGR